jgi:hypothetical protein
MSDEDEVDGALVAPLAVLGLLEPPQAVAARATPTATAASLREVRDMRVLFP